MPVPGFWSPVDAPTVVFVINADASLSTWLEHAVSGFSPGCHRGSPLRVDCETDRFWFHAALPVQWGGTVVVVTVIPIDWQVVTRCDSARVLSSYPTKIRTWTNRIKICCAAITLSGKNELTAEF